MKNNIARWAAGLLAAAVLAGCGTAAQQDSADKNPAAGYMGMAYEESAGLDPITCASSENRAILDLCLEGLFELDSNFVAHPALCESYQRVAEREYRFVIREDAVFHSGEPVTAEDVVYCLNRAREEINSNYFEQLMDIDTVEAEDERTVVIHLRKENTELPLLLTVPVFRAESEADGLPDGTGPYCASADKEQVLIPFDQWLGGEVNYCQEIALVEQNGADLTLGSDVTFALREDPEAETISGEGEGVSVPSTVMQYFGFNCDLAPLDDEEVRRGLSLLLDRDEIVKACYPNTADAAALPVNFSVAGMESVTQVQQQEALEALREGGVYDRNEDGMLDYINENGEQFQFTVEIIYNENYPYKATAAQMYAQTLNEAGIQAEAVGQSYDQCREDLMNEAFQIYLGEMDVHATFDLSSLLTSDGQRNYSGYYNSDMEDAIDALKSCEADAYDETLREYLTLFQEEAPIAPLLFQCRQMIFSGPLPENLDPWVTDLFHGMNQWTPGA